MLREEDPELLSDDGHLHVRQFYAFGEANFIPPTDIRDMVSSFVSPSKILKTIQAYKFFLSSLFREASGPKGYTQFCKARNAEEKLMDPVIRRERGSLAQVAMQNKIKAIEELLISDKPFAKYVGQQRYFKKKKNCAEKKFLGKKAYEPSELINKYLSSDYTIAIERKLIEAASKMIVLTPKEINEITTHLLLRISCKGGYRKQAFQSFKWKHYIQAKKTGTIAFPLRQIPEEEKKRINMKFVQGFCATILIHKTPKSPSYIWFSRGLLSK